MSACYELRYLVWIKCENTKLLIKNHINLIYLKVIISRPDNNISWKFRWSGRFKAHFNMVKHDPDSQRKAACVY